MIDPTMKGPTMKGPTMKGPAAATGAAARVIARASLVAALAPLLWACAGATEIILEGSACGDRVSYLGAKSIAEPAAACTVTTDERGVVTRTLDVGAAAVETDTSRALGLAGQVIERLPIPPAPP